MLAHLLILLSLLPVTSRADYAEVTCFSSGTQANSRLKKLELRMQIDTTRVLVWPEFITLSELGDLTPPREQFRSRDIFLDILHEAQSIGERRYVGKNYDDEPYLHKQLAVTFNADMTQAMSDQGFALTLDLYLHRKPLIQEHALRCKRR